jgi:hypothetical protein
MGELSSEVITGEGSSTGEISAGVTVRAGVNGRDVVEIGRGSSV